MIISSRGGREDIGAHLHIHVGPTVFHFITSQLTECSEYVALVLFSRQDTICTFFFFMYRIYEHPHARVTWSTHKVKGWKLVIIRINKMGVLKSTLVSEESLHVHRDCCRWFILITSPDVEICTPAYKHLLHYMYIEFGTVQSDGSEIWRDQENHHVYHRLSVIPHTCHRNSRDPAYL